MEFTIVFCVIKLTGMRVQAVKGAGLVSVRDDHLTIVNQSRVFVGRELSLHGIDRTVYFRRILPDVEVVYLPLRYQALFFVDRSNLVIVGFASAAAWSQSVRSFSET